MTQLEKDRALGYLYLLLEMTRVVEKTQNIDILMETWGAATMAAKCGLITASSLERILRYLDKKEAEIKASIYDD